VNRTSMRRAVVPTVAALTLGFGLAACGAGNEDTGSGGSTKTLAGGGATSQAKAQSLWRANYQGMHSDTTITYDEVGSGDGRKGFISGAYAFAGSDSYMKDDEGELTSAKQHCDGEDPIEVPAYVSPIAVAFNLPGIDKLNMSAETIAKIFSGKITKWNDPAIAEDNKGVNLPATAISTVHRQDDSGTTKNFTDYLSKAGNGAWTAEADSLWPDGLKGEAADGTSGVIGVITDTEGMIGYADHSATEGLGVVSIEVGKAYVAPSAEGAAKALSVSKPVSGRPAVDMAIDIDRTTTQAGAYPLILTSYLIACQHYATAEQADLVKGFLSYIVSTDGQQAAADQVASAPLDAALQAKAAGIVAAIAAK
jgi:phosphate transport system substrate-binding protein